MFETAMFLELLGKVRDLCHENSKAHGFWGVDEKSSWNFGEKIALIHSELSELLEAWRKGHGPSEKDITVTRGCALVRITAIEEELADVFIRLMDLCGKLDIDVGRVVLAKMEYNKGRAHMHGGRKC